MAEKTTQKVCPECGAPFEHQLRYESKRRFCSKSCRLRAWRHARHEKDPEKVRAEWRAAHERQRPQRLARMNEYHWTNRERLLEQRRQEYAENREKHQATDQARWNGDRREKGNEMKRFRDQETRLSTPWKALLRRAEARAAKKGVPFSLTETWAQERWTGRCEITGLEFRLGQRGSGPKVWGPSIDRIKPELGYVPENCRFVLWAVNAFKNTGTDEDMLIIARAILDKYQ